MNRRHRFIYYLLLSVIFIILLSGCSENSQINSSMDSENLNGWVGRYGYYEFNPPNMNMEYVIYIYNDNNDYYADIYIDGFQTNRWLRAKVTGNENAIDLVFIEYFSGYINALYQKGDILLSFQKRNGELYTYWEEIQPMLTENKEPGVYFWTGLKED